jgi:heterodisulfide reductase subunit B
MGMQGLDHITWLALAARNLCIAEELDLDILTLCNGCYETLKTANTLLEENPYLRAEINKILAKIGKQFQGKIKVFHLIQILYEDVGPQKIKSLVQIPLRGIRVGAHYGCHLVRPSTIMKFDDPEQPSSLDKLITALGARSVRYPKKMLCCGAGLRGIDSNSAMAIARIKLANMKRAGVDCMVVTCPYCMIQYDLSQHLIQRAFNEVYNIPVFYYPELLCLAMGEKPEELGFKFHRVDPTPVFEKIQKASP